jgi:hypothetical protein
MARSLVEAGKATFKVFLSESGRGAVENRGMIKGKQESRLDRAFALAQGRIVLDRAMGEFPFFRNGIAEGNNLPTGRISKAGFEDGIYSFLGKLHSEELRQLPTEFNMAKDLLDQMKDIPGVAEYFQAMVRYSVEAKNDPSNSRYRYVDKAGIKNSQKISGIMADQKMSISPI